MKDEKWHEETRDGKRVWVCNECGSIANRNGSCIRCPNCGACEGCS